MSEESSVAFDILYATVFPFFYIFVGYATYAVFLSNDKRLCYCVSEEQYPHLITNNEKIDNRSTFRYFQFCKTLGKICCQNDRLMDKNGCKCTCKCKEWFACIFSCIYCVFPCMPFSCFTHKYIIIKDFECCMVENNEKYKPIIDCGSNESKDKLKDGKENGSGNNENKTQNNGANDPKRCNKYEESKYNRMGHASGSDTNKESNKDKKDRQRDSNGNKEPPKDGKGRESGSDTNKEQNKGAKGCENGSENEEPPKDGEDRESGSNESQEQNKGAKDCGSRRNENEQQDNDGNEQKDSKACKYYCRWYNFKRKCCILFF